MSVLTVRLEQNYRKFRNKLKLGSSVVEQQQILKIARTIKCESDLLLL